MPVVVCYVSDATGRRLYWTPGGRWSRMEHDAALHDDEEAAGGVASYVRGLMLDPSRIRVEPVRA